MSQNLTIEQLKTYFKTNGIKGYSGKNKAQLMQLYNESLNKIIEQKEVTGQNSTNTSPALIPDLAQVMAFYSAPEDYYKLMQTDPKTYTLKKYEAYIAEIERERENKELENFEIEKKQIMDEQRDDFDIGMSLQDKADLLKDNIDHILDIMQKLGMIEILNNIEIVGYKNKDIHLRVQILGNLPGLDFSKIYGKAPIGILYLQLPRNKKTPELKFEVFKFVLKPGIIESYTIPQTPLYKLLFENMLALSTLLNSDQYKEYFEEY